MVVWLACGHQLIFRLMRWKGLSLHPEEQVPHSPPWKSNSNPTSTSTPPPPYTPQVVQSDEEASTEFLSSCLVEGFTPGGGVSCAKPGGQNGRNCVHSQGTGMVWLLCACGSVLSAHLNGRTSRCSLPTCTCRVSHLHIQGKCGRLISFWRLAKYSLCMKADPYQCVSCGVPWGESSWCTLCCSRRSRSGEFASFSVCQEIQQGEDVVCPNELLLMGY